MPKFSRRSALKLETVDPKLRMLMYQAIKHIDFTIISAQRDEAEQNELFERGLSEKRFPESRHNTRPLSMAVDIAPFPIDWKDEKRFYFLAGVVLTLAAFADIPVRWGGDWDSDRDFSDQTFMDLGHFELLEE